METSKLRSLVEEAAQALSKSDSLSAGLAKADRGKECALHIASRFGTANMAY